MKCPHCLVAFHERLSKTDLVHDVDRYWSVTYTKCPECGRVSIFLGFSEFGWDAGDCDYILVHPKGIARAPLPKEVPDEFAADYKEACLVLADSPKASAALSRRCLQNLLRERAGVKKSNLSDEIEQAISSKQLPSPLSDAIDAVRNIGNFAAHPIKSTHTREIVDVEPGEAEWLLDVLEGLFDFYFVQPARLKAKKDALNKKLKEAGKPPMK